MHYSGQEGPFQTRDLVISKVDINFSNLTFRFLMLSFPNLTFPNLSWFNMQWALDITSCCRIMHLLTVQTESSGPSSAMIMSGLGSPDRSGEWLVMGKLKNGWQGSECPIGVTCSWHSTDAYYNRYANFLTSQEKSSQRCFKGFSLLVCCWRSSRVYGLRVSTIVPVEQSGDMGEWILISASIYSRILVYIMHGTL